MYHQILVLREGILTNCRVFFQHAIPTSWNASKYYAIIKHSHNHCSTTKRSCYRASGTQHQTPLSCSTGKLLFFSSGIVCFYPTNSKYMYKACSILFFHMPSLRILISVRLTRSRPFAWMWWRDFYVEGKERVTLSFYNLWPACLKDKRKWRSDNIMQHHFWGCKPCY